MIDYWLVIKETTLKQTRQGTIKTLVNEQPLLLLLGALGALGGLGGPGGPGGARTERAGLAVCTLSWSLGAQVVGDAAVLVQGRGC